jgi:hypothetical protein
MAIHFSKLFLLFFIYFFFNRPEEIQKNKNRKPQKENWGHWKERRKISIGNNRWFSPFSVDNSVCILPLLHSKKFYNRKHNALNSPHKTKNGLYETLSLPFSHFFLSRAAGPVFFVIFCVYRPSSSINRQPSAGILYFHVS